MTRELRGRLPGDWKGLVVFFAGTAWDGNRFPDQHIAGRLTRWAPVLYVDPPLSAVSRGTPLTFTRPGIARQLRLVDDRLARFTPVVLPPKGRGPMRRVTERTVRLLTRRALRLLDPEPDVAVAVAATPASVLGHSGERLQVLYATDDFRVGGALMGIPDRWLERQEREGLFQADVVVCVSDHLAGELAGRGARRTVVIENGVDDALFARSDEAPLPDDVPLAAPVAGFVGHLSDRIDLPMLEATAATGCSLLLVGPRQGTFEIARMEALLRRPNVCWVGAKPFEALPSYLRLIDVGLLPYTTSEFNRASFPLKVLEYLAAGRPAVCSDLPAVRTLGPVVTVASTPDAFAGAVTRELARPRDEAAVAERRAAARARSWDRAAERFATVLGLPLSGHLP